MLRYPGSSTTPAHKLKHAFKFKDYSPKIFSRLRDHFNLDEAEYLTEVMHCECIPVYA